jgi:hypothetical protein
MVIILRVCAAYVQVCSVAHWTSSHTSAVVPALLGPQEMELLAMTWMRLVHHCVKFVMTYCLLLIHVALYCTDEYMIFTISVCECGCGCVCECAHVCVSVHVCERECVCVRERERESMCECERERERECVFTFICVT